MTDIDIFAAVKAVDLDAVQAILDQSPDHVRKTNSSGYTPLHMAAYHSRSPELVGLLLDRGANPDEGGDPDPENGKARTSPLMRALGGLDSATGENVQKQEEIIELLLSQGASVHGVKGAYPPMHTAVLDGRLRVIQLMLPRWGDVNRDCGDLGTLLHVAAAKGYREIVEFLLANGALADLPDNEGLTAADLAAERYPEIAELLNGADYDIDVYLSQGGDLALQLLFEEAVSETDPKQLARCLRIYPPLGDRAIRDTPPLCLAARSGCLEAVQLLILYGTSVDSRDASGRTAAQNAEDRGHADVCQFLMRAASAGNGAERWKLARAEIIKTWASRQQQGTPVTLTGKGDQTVNAPQPPSDQEIERIRQQELARAQAEARECKARAEMYSNAANRLDQLIEQNEKAKKSGCYIATACYGNYDHPDVVVLRKFRDERLLPTPLGKHLVNLYYAVSPKLAAWVGSNRWLSRIVRRVLLEPVVRRLVR